MGSVGKLKCHKEDDKECLTSAIMCSFMNDCSVNGKCSDDTGRCTCNPGFFGQDCSDTIVSLDQGPTYTNRVTVQGISWLYYIFNGTLAQNEAFELQLSSSNPMDIYISADPAVEPSEFQNDMEIKKQSRFILRSASLPAFKTFVMAIRVNGANLYENAYYKSQVFVNFKRITQ